MSIRLKIWLAAMASAVLLIGLFWALLAATAPIVAAGVVLALFAPIAWLLAYFSYGPIRYVRKTAQGYLARGDVSGRCWYAGPRDDVGDLVVIMNDLLIRYDAALGALQRARAAPPACACPRPESATDPADLVLDLHGQGMPERPPASAG